MRFIIKKCRPTNPSNVFITIILKLENAMKPSGVPDHLFLNKRVFRISITFQVTLRTFFTNLKKKKYSKKKKKNDLNKVKRSESGLSDIQKFEKTVGELQLSRLVYRFSKTKKWHKKYIFLGVYTLSKKIFSLYYINLMEHSQV